MRRRITEAIVGVSALILLVLGIPLAIAVHRSILDSEVVELQATAARTLTEIDVPLNLSELAAVSGMRRQMRGKLLHELRLKQSSSDPPMWTCRPAPVLFAGIAMLIVAPGAA